MSIKLTDTQLVLISAASRRSDLYLTLPTGSKFAPARKACAKLPAEGLAREIRARNGLPDLATG